MTTSKASTLTLKYFSSSSCKQTEIIKASVKNPKRFSGISLPGLRTRASVEKQPSPAKMIGKVSRNGNPNMPDQAVVAKLYTILEAVADRVEMHKNVGDQRDNWNSLLLTSINSITLFAATMVAIGGGAPLKISSTILYVAATGMLCVMNKIQPSQLAEEQRIAARLFKQLQNQIQTAIFVGNPTAADVREMMEKVLALDKAYPLPLLGAMIEKFPMTVEPAVSWPEKRRQQIKGNNKGCNGWNRKLEEEMIEVVKVLRLKDEQDYLKLSKKALKLNKILAIAGPVLTGLAAVGSALAGTAVGGGWAAEVGVVGGALASVVNTLEHGGQVGMVFEMYRSNAGFFKMIEESIEWNLREEDLEKRDNGEVFEMKVGLQLGRSLSQLRDLATAAAADGEDIHEFGSKLF